MDQQELFPFLKARITDGSRTVIAVETKIGVFGNRTDLIVVDEGTVGGASLVECDNSDVLYFNNQSASPFSDSL